MGKPFCGRREDGYLFDPDFNCCLHAFGVGHQAGVADAGQLIDLLVELLGTGHLGHPLGRHEGPHLDHREPGLGQTIDQFDLVLQGEDQFLVLQPIAGPHLHNLDLLPQESWVLLPEEVSSRPNSGQPCSLIHGLYFNAKL